MRTIFAVAIAFLLHPSRSAAQELARSARLTLDNDYFVFWLPPGQRPDDNYTQGARLSWDMANAAALGRRFVCGPRSACGTKLEVGQEMYTPTVDAPTPVPGERPYAGWLYGRVAVRGADARTLRSVGIILGVTGPPSLAELSQEVFHRLIPGFREPLGWAHQIPTELAFAIRMDKTWRFAPRESGSLMVEMLPSANVTLGTLRTSIGAGARARAGAGLRHPWRTAIQTSRLGVYGLLGVRGESIARDLFLDGSTFRPSVRVDRESFLTEWERGIGISAGRLHIEYRAVTRSREYRTGPRTHTHGSVRTSWDIH